MNIHIIWLVIIIFAVLVEGLTTQLVAIWFMAGAIFALISSLFAVSLEIQIIIFIIVSILTLVLARPFMKKFMNFKKEDTNVGRYIGKSAIVTTEINNNEGKGQVSIGGNYWTAKSDDNMIINKGENVCVLSIEGVKLIVSSRPKI